MAKIITEDKTNNTYRALGLSDNYTKIYPNYLSEGIYRDVVLDSYSTSIPGLDERIEHIYKKAGPSYWWHVKRTFGFIMLLLSDYREMFGKKLNKEYLFSAIIASRMHDIGVSEVDSNDSNYKEEHMRIGAEIARPILESYNPDLAIDDICLLISIHDDKDMVKSLGTRRPDLFPAALLLYEADKLDRYGIYSADRFNHLLAGKETIFDGIERRKEAIYKTFLTPDASVYAHALIKQEEKYLNNAFWGSDNARNLIELAKLEIGSEFDMSRDGEKLRVADHPDHDEIRELYISKKLIEMFGLK